MKDKPKKTTQKSITNQQTEHDFWNRNETEEDGIKAETIRRLKIRRLLDDKKE